MIEAFKKDLSFGEKNEKQLVDIFKELWRKVEETNRTDILDFKLIDKKGRDVWLELKTRRCEKDTYSDTMIWLNKLIEAYKRYDTDGTYTLFLFKFTDGIYYINPFLTTPRFDYKQWRWDRWGFDKKKGWVYYDIGLLTKLEKEWKS